MTHKILNKPVTLTNNTQLPLSHAIRAGDFVFLPGQLGLAPDGSLPAGIEAQTRQCLKNISRVLATAGLDFTHIFKTTI